MFSDNNFPIRAVSIYIKKTLSLQTNWPQKKEEIVLGIGNKPVMLPSLIQVGEQITQDLIFYFITYLIPNWEP